MRKSDWTIGDMIDSYEASRRVVEAAKADPGMSESLLARYDRVATETASDLRRQLEQRSRSQKILDTPIVHNGKVYYADVLTPATMIGSYDLVSACDVPKTIVSERA